MHRRGRLRTCGGPKWQGIGGGDLDKHLGQLQKEQRFAGVLKAMLISREYTVAVPEPDTGDDLWFAKLVPEKGKSITSMIYRAQCKSISSWELYKREGKRVYSTNIDKSQLERAINQPGFVFFFGLRHDDGPEHGYNPACIAASFFSDKLGKLGLGAKGQGSCPAYNIYFHYYDDKRIELWGKSPCKFDVTKYFGDVQCGINEAEPRESARIGDGMSDLEGLPEIDRKL